jgi:hypothetical protein
VEFPEVAPRLGTHLRVGNGARSGGAVLNPPESRSPRRVEGICRQCLDERWQEFQRPAEVDAGPWGLLCWEHFDEITIEPPEGA